MPVVTATCPKRLNQPVPQHQKTPSRIAVEEYHTSHPGGERSPFFGGQNCCPEIWTSSRRNSTNNLCHSETDKHGEEADDEPTRYESISKRISGDKSVHDSRPNHSRLTLSLLNRLKGGGWMRRAGMIMTYHPDAMTAGPPVVRPY